jgi:hypothetical protein
VSPISIVENDRGVSRKPIARVRSFGKTRSARRAITVEKCTRTAFRVLRKSRIENPFGMILALALLASLLEFHLPILPHEGKPR